MRIAALFALALMSACGLVDDDVSRMERIEAEATAEAVADDVVTEPVAEVIADCVVENATDGELRTLAALNNTDPAIGGEERVAAVVGRTDTVECIAQTDARPID